MAHGVLSATFIDESREISTYNMRMDPVPIDATDQSALQTALNEHLGYLQAISAGTYRANSISNKDRITNAPGPADSHVEQKLLVVFEDDTTKELGTIEIPCFDDGAGVVFKSNSDEVDMLNTPRGGTAFDNWATSFEGLAKTRAGNSVTVISARRVGRNL